MKNQILKQIAVVAIALLTIFSTVSCKKDKNFGGLSSGKTGTFTIDGTSYTGNTEIQTFVNANYSIVCQQDDPFNFVQITFHNKAEAEAGGTFDVDDYSLNIASGSVNIGTGDIITANPVGTHTISVINKKITFSNVKIKSTSSSTNSTISTANINF